MLRKRVEFSKTAAKGVITSNILRLRALKLHFRAVLVNNRTLVY